jgi:hypothetical protein
MNINIGKGRLHDNSAERAGEGETDSRETIATSQAVIIDGTAHVHGGDPFWTGVC